MDNTPANLVIRKAHPGDVPVLHSLIRELAEFENLLHEVHSDVSSLHDALFHEPPAAEAFIAEWKNEPAGFALYFHNYSTFAGKRGIYLEDLYVRPDLRRHGIGKALLHAIARIGAERNCGRFEWAVLDWNTNAIEFYRSIGAQILPDWRICRMTEPDIRHFAASPPLPPNN